MAVRLTFDEVMTAASYVRLHLIPIWRTSPTAKVTVPALLGFEVRPKVLTKVDRRHFAAVEAESGVSSLTVVVPVGGGPVEDNGEFWNDAATLLIGVVIHELTHLRQHVHARPAWDCGGHARKVTMSRMPQDLKHGADRDYLLPPEQWLDPYYACGAEIEAHSAQFAVETDERVTNPRSNDIEASLAWRRIARRLARASDDPAYAARFEQWKSSIHEAVKQHRVAWSAS